MIKFRLAESGTSFIEEPREIPVARSYDVIVAGGGSAGVGAAIAARRMGARTLVIERNGCLGGNATAGMMALFGSPSDSLSGYMKDLLSELLSLGAAQEGTVIPFDPEVLKRVLLGHMLKGDVDLLFYSWIADAIVDGHQVRGVIVENKSGRQAILAHSVIDATGDGDVAAFAGAEYQKGREDGAMRPVTILFRMGNVDIQRLINYASMNPDQFMTDPHMNFVKRSEGKLRLAGFFELVEGGRNRGELDREINYLRVESADFDKRIVLINTVRVYGIDGTDSWDVTRGEIRARQQMDQLIPFMKRHIPGFGNAFLVDSSTILGVRETRHIVGEYILTSDDILTRREFDDVVSFNCSHLPQGKEMHSPEGGEGGAEDGVNRTEPWPLLCYEIPYRSLVVKGLSHLLVAGRCISATHGADRQTRNIPPCVMTGQAAGTAAGLASKRSVAPSALDIRALQAALLKQGVNLGHPISSLEVENSPRS